MNPIYLPSLLQSNSVTEPMRLTYIPTSILCCFECTTFSWESRHRSRKSIRLQLRPTMYIHVHVASIVGLFFLPATELNNQQMNFPAMTFRRHNIVFQSARINGHYFILIRHSVTHRSATELEMVGSSITRWPITSELM